MFGFGGGIKGKSPKEILSKYYISTEKKYHIESRQLSKAVGLSANDYASNFTPNNTLVNDLTFGSISGSSIGTIHGAVSVISNAIGAANRAYIRTSFGLGGFFLPESDGRATELEKLAALASNGEMTKDEFVKSIASLVFDGGNGSPSFIKFDKLGSPIFGSDKEKLVAAMIYQFWAENCVPASRVREAFLD